MHHNAAATSCRTPAAALSSAPASSAAPAASRVFHWMRVSAGFALVVSAARMVAGTAIPSPSAALGLAGG